MRASVLAISALLALPASAGQQLDGNVIRISYGDDGVWNSGAERAGLEVKHGDDWVDYTYPGTPYASWRLQWEDGGSAPEEYFVSSASDADNVTDILEEDLSTSAIKVSRYTYNAGAIRVQKSEAWAVNGSAILVHWLLINEDSRPVSNMVLLYAADPDQDNGTTTNTLNSSRDSDGDGQRDRVVSIGPESGRTIMFGACDANVEVGHFNNWRGNHNARVDLSKLDGEEADAAMAIRLSVPGTLQPGESAQLAFLVAVGDNDGATTAIIEANDDLCASCDVDADGWLDPDCGGLDCDDDDAAANPGQTEVWYDGVDGDCSGGSDFDADLDGSDSADHGGQDCDDTDPAVHPGATDTPYDGVDSDCDGASDLDADGDGFDSGGHGGDDCDDGDPSTHPGAEDVEGDGKDSDCDGHDGPRPDPELVNGGCGCSSGSTGLSGGLLGLVLAFGLVRRRESRRRASVAQDG